MVRSGVVATFAFAVLGFSFATFGAMTAVAAVPDDSYHGKGGAPVDFTDFTPRGTQPELFFGLQPSGNCAGCHSRTPAENRLTDQYPTNSWSGSMMANATRDPLFWAALDVANQDGEQNGAEGIGDYCLRCHAPDAWYGGRVRKLRDVEPVDGQVLPGDIVDGFDGCMLEGRPD